MKTLTDEKLTIVGAAGMIGSNMAQTAIMMGLTSNICLYDPYAPGLEGVAEELFHCGFEGVNITFTSDIKEALTGAKYIVNSGGAARKAGMTREDLLKGNAAIAEEFGKNVKAYCPDVKHILLRLRRWPHWIQLAYAVSWQNISVSLWIRLRIVVRMAVMASKWLFSPLPLRWMASL